MPIKVVREPSGRPRFGFAFFFLLSIIDGMANKVLSKKCEPDKWSQHLPGSNHSNLVERFPWLTKPLPRLVRRRPPHAHSKRTRCSHSAINRLKKNGEILAREGRTATHAILCLYTADCRDLASDLQTVAAIVQSLLQNDATGIVIRVAGAVAEG